MVNLVAVRKGFAVKIGAAAQQCRAVGADMTVSMTGFATRKGQGLGHVWTWDVRSVNGKGLDLRLRLPDWVDGLEALVRAELQKSLGRGNVSLSLKLARDTAEPDSGARLNPSVLRAMLAAMHEVETVAEDMMVALARPTAADVLGLRGVLDAGTTDLDTGPLRDLLLADMPHLLADFTASRMGEGAALNAVISAQIQQIADLTAAAKSVASARRDAADTQLRENVARLLAATDAIDETRLAQELALLAVKTDVTEEIDRLTAHIAAGRALLREKGPVGRKFDFLMQEFMRETNTLCSKAQDIELTRIGLDLKTVIDQMREQVQNVE